MSVWTPARRHDPEWMDRKDNDHEDLCQALRDIGLVNRRLGGARVLLRALEPLIRSTPPGEVLEILDVGTGGADLPILIVRASERLGRRTQVTAVDIEPATVEIAARAASVHPEIRLIRADAFNLPFAESSFDVVTASMFLHHFAHADCVRLLASFRRLARRAVLVNDLRRHRLPWAFIALAARATRRHPMFVHDAPLSVLRGFTEDELLAAGREAGGLDARLARRWPFRLILSLPASRTGP